MFQLWLQCLGNDSTDSLQCKIKALLSHLMKLNVLSPSSCNKTVTQYIELLKNELKLFNGKFRSFDRKVSRLDDFFFATVGIQNYKELSYVLKIILILSHGQASVERSFSVNKSILGVNMKVESIVARKVIRDHMLSNKVQPHTI